MKGWLIIGLILFSSLTYYFFFSQDAIDSSVKRKLIAAQENQETVTIYGSPQPQTYQAMTMLEIRGIDYQFVPINKLGDFIDNFPQVFGEDTFDEEKPLSAIELANEMNKRLSAVAIKFPIITFPDDPDNLIPQTSFFNAISKVPLSNLNDGKSTPYVIVYGVKNCAYTDQTRIDLEERNIPYTYIDVNTNPAVFMGQLTAKAEASGNTDGKFQMPMVEVNGYVKSRMSTDEIVKKYENY